MTVADEPNWAPLDLDDFMWMRNRSPSTGLDRRLNRPDAAELPLDLLSSATSGGFE
jgi:hypothetical protein